LAPLIPCIQDSNQLYDFVVRLMFLLHANLPDDLLSGHRERFKTLFRQLNSFYKHSAQLQYFVNLIKVPSLPSSPPNFLVQSDLGNYIPPVVVVNSQDSDANSVVENLVDTSQPEMPVMVKTPPPLPSIDFDTLLKERDEMIRNQRVEIDHQQKIMERMTQQQLELRGQEQYAQEKLATLSFELTETKNNFAEVEKQDLEVKIQTTPNFEGECADFTMFYVA
jgi:huntingtin interacting protein 1